MIQVRSNLGTAVNSKPGSPEVKLSNLPFQIGKTALFGMLVSVPYRVKGVGGIEHSNSCTKSYSCWASCCEASSCRLDGDYQHHCAYCCGQFVSSAQTCTSNFTAYSEAYSQCSLHYRTCAYCSTQGWPEWSWVRGRSRWIWKWWVRKLRLPRWQWLLRELGQLSIASFARR